MIITYSFFVFLSSSFILFFISILALLCTMR
jgi:hypothetical protein